MQKKYELPSFNQIVINFVQFCTIRLVVQTETPFFNKFFLKKMILQKVFIISSQNMYIYINKNTNQDRIIQHFRTFKKLLIMRAPFIIQNDVQCARIALQNTMLLLLQDLEAFLDNYWTITILQQNQFVLVLIQILL
eukprot:TRINITY_DN18088_c0_g1_i11.p5 TRINITY_DN18088_c0_g1~~TRINITY_DN18088_c0_g1_i11.p5  ORF type:complete len:137 (-),score=0.47 TRINITY_DN18088_c0_g1_i11:375-785(-)